MERISRLERAVNKLSRDKYDVADLENISLYPKESQASVRFSVAKDREVIDKAGFVSFSGKPVILFHFIPANDETGSGFVCR
jgi:hypothetical protein